MLRIISLFVLSLLILGCASKPVATQNITYGDRSTLAFSGKGAAAGMMMDAYMGGAGIAIGIAIDEGIAKDISANLAGTSGGFDMLALMLKELNSIVKVTNNQRKQILSTKIIVETYGFRSAKGEGDKVSAWLKIRFSNQDGDIFLNYPDDFAPPSVIEFNDAKKNPELAYNTLKDATDLVLEKWISMLK